MCNTDNGNAENNDNSTTRNIDEIQRIADFAKNRTILEGKKVHIDDILNIDLVFTGWKIGTSHYKDKNARNQKCLTLQFDMDGNKCIIFTSSNVLMQQLNDFIHANPTAKVFRSKIKHVENRFYKFSN
jgi:hypothetical protein